MFTIEGFQLTVTRNLDVTAGIQTMAGLYSFSSCIHLATADSQLAIGGMDGVCVCCRSGNIGICQGDVAAACIDCIG